MKKDQTSETLKNILLQMKELKTKLNQMENRLKAIEIQKKADNTETSMYFKD